MRKLCFLTLPIMACVLLTCTTAVESAESVATENSVPATPPNAGLTTTNFPLARLLAVKHGIEAKEPAHLRMLDELIDRADQELSGPVYTIVNKEILPPSGSPNDYLSLAPYWWPDPEKADGLPWIRRDGEVNPMTTGELVDKTRRGKFFRAVEALAYANYLTGEAKYGARADTLLVAWFVNPATRMNPNLNYAQGIPGVNTGRCFGIIEFTGVTDIVTSLELLQLSSALDPETIAGVDRWLADYADWLQTSELGIEEGTRDNNHGTWYDVQLASMLIHLGRMDDARRVVEGTKQRIDAQIAPDGAQPEELARTKSLSYSTMNLKAFTRLAYLATNVGVELWSYRSANGGGIPQAYTFLAPYAGGDEPWALPQLGDPDEVMKGTRELFGVAGSLFARPDFCAIASRGQAQPSLEDLLYLCPSN